MKTFIAILILVLLGGAAWWWSENGGLRPQTDEAVTPGGEDTRLCFYSEKDSPDSGFSDKYSLWMVIEDLTAGSVRKDDAKVTGELKLLPAEKDSLVGSFMGVNNFLGETGKVVGTWKTEGEGMTADQELELTYDEDSAEIGLGEMTLDNISNRYIYKDRSKVDFSLSIPAVPCEDFDERARVEAMLWENIITLSPVAPVLGGKWYVVSADIDLEKNSGTVIYEDGHIQEKRSFFYTTDQAGAVQSLTIE